MSPLRYAIIGAGGIIAPTHIAAIQRLGGHVVGLCDSRSDRVQERAQAVGCPAFEDHNAMLSAVRADVVVVCTPHPSHGRMALDALAAGLHVLCEKPIAVEVGEADQMVAAAEAAAAKGQVFAVNFQHRIRPSTEWAKQFITSGQLGDLLRVLVVEPWLRTAAYYRSATWRGTWAGEGGGVLLNQSPHTIDLMCHLAGMPVKVWGWTRTRFQPMECEDTAQATLEYENGAPGYFTASTTEAGDKRRIEIIGEKAAIEIVGDTLTVRRYSQSLREFTANDPGFFSSPTITTEVMDLPADDTQGNHYAVYRDLEGAIAEGRPPRCTAREGLMSLELANAITLSSHTERPVTLPVDRTAYHDLRQHLIRTARSAEAKA